MIDYSNFPVEIDFTAEEAGREYHLSARYIIAGGSINRRLTAILNDGNGKLDLYVLILVDYLLTNF